MLFAQLESTVLQENGIDMVAPQAANFDNSERLLEAQIDLALDSMILDLERSMLVDKTDAVTAQQATVATGELQLY